MGTKWVQNSRQFWQHAMPCSNPIWRTSPQQAISISGTHRQQNRDKIRVNSGNNDAHETEDFRLV
jgi:hypothetical protein